MIFCFSVGNATRFKSPRNNIFQLQVGNVAPSNRPFSAEIKEHTFFPMVFKNKNVILLF